MFNNAIQTTQRTVPYAPPLLAAEVLRRVWPPEALQELVLPEQRHHETAWEPRFRDFLALFLAQK